jgi:uncharacterized damage-inducible protein DinB
MTRPDPFDLGEALALLERTPASLCALLEHLPQDWLEATEGGATWSPREVVGHLLYCERANWLPRASHILQGGGPLPPFDRHRHLSEYRDRPADALLAEFAEARRQSLATLRGMKLTPADLNRTGQHPDLGTVSLGQLLATWVVHDLDHMVQVARTLAKRYAREVGPWSAYLSVLRDRT